MKGKELTANELTKAVLKRLNAQPGVMVWRQNNHTTRGRSFRGRRGIGDILGIVRPGVFLSIEIKVGRDKLSQAQKEFIQDVTGLGGIAGVVGSLEELEVFYDAQIGPLILKNRG
ncbi:MAG: VRR-NUC domain-containing protein [Bacteroidota bacterium]